jgi:hypothetical protein
MTLLRDKIEVTLPLVVTADEAKAQGIDTSKGTAVTEKVDGKDVTKYYFYDLTYTVTNNRVLLMPLSGGDGLPIGYLFGGFGIVVIGILLMGKKSRKRGC